jgi:anti-sigma B factor antagonist
MLEVAPPQSPRTPLAPEFETIVLPEGDRTTVDVRGELCITTIQPLASCLERLRAEGADQLVLDLRNLAFMDSCGIRFLHTMDALAREEGFSFAIVEGDGQPKRALGLVDMAERPRRVWL